MRTSVTFLMLAMFVLVGCSHLPLSDHSDVRSLPWLKGSTFTQLSSKYGPHTAVDDTWPASTAIGELRAPIRQMFPLGSPETQGVLIREVWWLRGDRYVSVFFRQQHGQWVAIDAVQWQKDVEF